MMILSLYDDDNYPPWFNPACHCSGSEGFPTHQTSWLPAKQRDKSWIFWHIYVDTTHKAAIVKLAFKQKTFSFLLNDHISHFVPPIVDRRVGLPLARRVNETILSQRFHPREGFEDCSKLRSGNCNHHWAVHPILKAQPLPQFLYQ